MSVKHYLLILLITFLFGSSYPVGKLIFNDSVPPLLMGSMRMLIVLICLLPFVNFKIPKKKYWLPLFGFGIFMGFATNLFLNYSIYFADILSRMGLYPGAPSPPFTPGMEVSGTIDQLGPDVDGFKILNKVKGIIRKSEAYQACQYIGLKNEKNIHYF